DTEEVELEFYLTTPFASGAAFADSVLDCILSCAYYNDNAVNLLRNILTGGLDLQLEEILAEGGGFTQCESSDILKKRNRARVAILEIRDLIPDIDTRQHPVTFSTLFCESIQRYNIICMGIYTLMDVLLRKEPNMNSTNKKHQEQIHYTGHKRIVICYPPYNYHIDPSDMIYVMQHSHPIDSYSRTNSWKKKNLPSLHMANYQHRYVAEEIDYLKPFLALSSVVLDMSVSLSDDENNDIEDCQTFQRVIRHISTLQPRVPVLLLRHPPVKTSAEAASLRQVSLASGAKAMLMFDKGSNSYFLIVLPANLSVDMKKLATVIGSPRSNIRMANENDVKKITGCKPGAVPPFGNCFLVKVETLIDEKMKISASSPPPQPLQDSVKLFSTKNDSEWPVDITELDSLSQTENENFINFNIGLRTVSCCLQYNDYLRVIGNDNYRIVDVSK
ncbi:unnamed protein product, partial [Didymodactylos carnosus]